MVGVVDYGMGNVGSVANIVSKAGAKVSLISTPDGLNDCQRIILPGVGSFDAAVERIDNQGWREALNQHVIGEKKPTLGICLGMQLLFTSSEEGSKKGLGWFEGQVRRFSSELHPLKIPHMGWNTVSPSRDHPLLEGLDSEHRFYFVHSYHVDCPEALWLCTTEYGTTFTSGVCQENIAAVQFHPEKSHRYGLRLMQNFVAWCPH